MILLYEKTTLYPKAAIYENDELQLNATLKEEPVLLFV